MMSKRCAPCSGSCRWRRTGRPPSSAIPSRARALAFAENDPNWHHKSKLTDELVAKSMARLDVDACVKTCLNMVYELAKQDERVVFVGSDLSPGLLADMKRDMPERWFMEGITEQNVVGMAAGLAMEGYIPYANTIATFITRRCYEQVAVDLCLHDLPVRLIG